MWIWGVFQVGRHQGLSRFVATGEQEDGLLGLRNGAHAAVLVFGDERDNHVEDNGGWSDEGMGNDGQAKD